MALYNYGPPPTGILHKAHNRSAFPCRGGNRNGGGEGREGRNKSMSFRFRISDFQIFDFRLLFFLKIFPGNMLVRYRGINNKGVMERRFNRLWPRLQTRYCPYRNLCSILAGCYFIDFHGFHEISWDFTDLRGRMLAGCCALWRPVASRSCPCRNLCSILTGCYFIDFHGFHVISWDFIDSRERKFAGLWPPVASRSCPYRNLCSILTGCYFIDFHGFH